MRSNAFSFRRRTSWFGLALLGGMILGAASAQASSTITRVSSWTYAANGLMTSETTQSTSTSTSSCISSPLTVNTSGDNTCSVTTTYAYNGYGNKTSATVTGTSLPAEATARTITTVYDSQGEFATSTINALGQLESWAYDARFGVPTIHTGPNGVTTKWNYDSLGRKAKEMRADSTSTDWTYAYCGGGLTCYSNGAYQVQTLVLGTDNVTQVAPESYTTYDTLGRVVETGQQAYNGATQTYSVSDTQYNGNGQVAQTSSPLFVGGTAYWTTYTYDPLGRVTQVQAPYENTSGTTSYGTTSYVYATASNALTSTVTDANGNTTTTTINAMGKPVTVTNAAGKIVTYTYDAVGDLLTTTDPNGNVTSYTYDVEGREIQMVDPDRGTWHYAYDALGELASQVDHDGNQTNSTYDVLGRMVTRVQLTPANAVSQTDDWTYDALPTGACTGCIGKLTTEQATNGTGATITSRTLGYDTLGRPVSTAISTNVPQTTGSLTETASGSFTTAYNTTTGLTNTVTYASGYVVQYNYSSIGTVSSLAGTPPGGTSVTLWTLNTTDAAGQATQETLGNGIVVGNVYDPSTGRVRDTTAGLSSATQTGDPSSANVASFAYLYDGLLGNLVWRVDFDADTPNTSTAPTELSEFLTYDNLYRLSTDTVFNGSTQTYSLTNTYDALGNITSRSDVGTYSYGTGTTGGPHAVSSITCSTGSTCTSYYNVNSNGASAYSYDANGNVLTGDGYTTGWNTYNMAASITNGTDIYTYTYDADHDRATQQQTKSGTLKGTTVYFNDSVSGLREELIVWSNGSHTGQWTDYFSVGGKVIGMYVKPTGTTAPYNRFFIDDHLGSVAVVTGDIGCSGLTLNGNSGTTSCLVERDSYDAWGRHRSPLTWTEDKNNTIGSPQSKLGYTGHEEVQDTSTGFQLVNANARMYDPTTGRFLSPDPLLPDAGAAVDYLNPYSYVFNNPLSATDPSGMKCHGGFFAGCISFHDILSIVAIAVAVFAPYALAFEEGASWGTLATGFAGYANAAIAGAAAGAISSEGNINTILISAATAGAFHGVGTFTDGGLKSEFGQDLAQGGANNADAFAGDYAARVAGDGLVGGLSSIASGGRFGPGFLAAGFSSAIGPQVLNNDGNLDAYNVAAEAVVGGVGSVLGGGKFASGAETGAFEYLFNQEAMSPGGVIGGLEGLGQDALAVGRTALGWAGALGDVLTLSGDTPEQQYVVRAGQASANSLQAGTTNSPNGYGFSVQTAPGLSPNALAAGAPNISKYGSYSYSTVMQLESIPGVEVASPTPGGGLYHGTVTLPYPAPPGIFGAISGQFSPVPNPYKSP